MMDETDRPETGAQTLMERYLWMALSVDMAAIIDLDGAFIESNPAWERFTGHSPSEMEGRYLLEYLHVEDRERTLAGLQRLVTADFVTTSADFRFYCKDESYRHLLANVAYTPEQNAFYIMARDISDPQTSCNVSAFHDMLTGLPNRYLLHERLQAVLGEKGESGAAVLFIDLDGFKPINDTHGHKAGDLVLQEVAGRLGRCVGKHGFVARAGGDEFVAVVHGEDSGATARRMAAEVVSTLAEPIDVLGVEVAIGASVGISLFPEHGRDPDALVQAADEAMYKVKRAGRGAFQVFSGEPIS